MQPNPKASSIVAAAVWMGIAFGLISGIELFLITVIEPPFSPRGLVSVNGDFIWLAPVAEVILFGLLAAPFAAGAWLFPRKFPYASWSAWLLAFVAFSGLLLAPALIHWPSALVLSAGITILTFRFFEPSDLIKRMRHSLAVVVVVWALSAGIIAGCSWTKERYSIRALPAAVAGRPNVLLIVLDTLRADSMSLYGYHRKTTPNLERLATEGTMFTQFMASSSWTLPSHASIFTGLPPGLHNAGPAKLGEEKATLAGDLSAAGYLTAGFVANTYLAHRHTGLGRDFVHYEGHFGPWAEVFGKTVYGRRIVPTVLPLLGYYDTPGRKTAQYMNRSFLKWLDAETEAGKSRPFFAFINYMDVHSPYVPPREYLAKFAKDPDGIFRRQPFNPLEGIPRKIREDRLQGEIDAYDASIAWLDTQIAELTSELQSRRILDNTILVITSDHGEEFNEHGRMGHSTDLYHEVLHVPLIIRFPRRVPAGVHNDAIGDHTSIAATILDLAGVKGRVSGESLFSRNCSSASADSNCLALAELDTALWEFRGPTQKEDVLYSVSTGRWHFLQWPDGRVELYDAISDTAEKQELSGTELGKAAVAALRPLLPAPSKEQLAQHHPSTTQRVAE